MSKYKYNNNLAYATNIKRTVTMKKGNTVKVKDVRRLKSEDGGPRRKKMRSLETKRDNVWMTKTLKKCIYYKNANVKFKCRLQKKKNGRESWVC